MFYVMQMIVTGHTLGDGFSIGDQSRVRRPKVHGLTGMTATMAATAAATHPTETAPSAGRAPAVGALYSINTHEHVGYEY